MKHRRRRHQNKRLVSIFGVLIFSIVLLASSTYAWFSSNRIVEASAISVRVSTVKSLKVSTDAREWRTSVTLGDIKSASYVGARYNSTPTIFEPVSTVGNVGSNGQLEMFYGSLVNSADGYVLTATKTTDVDGNSGKYLAFDLYFYNEQAFDVYLSDDSTIKYEFKDGETNTSGIENAMRVAFVNEGETDKNSSLATIQSLKTTDSNNVVIWEPNANAHTSSGITAADVIYDKEIESNELTNLTYYGVKSEITTAIPAKSTDEAYVGLINNLYPTSTSGKLMSGTSGPLFTFSEGISKIRIYVWVEGQDVDCENMTADSNFVFDLKFTTNEADSF